jgi:YidC/Oxa1 family membrane protein insertase
MADQKNLFLAVALSIVILITWNVMVEQPKMEKERIALEQQEAAQKVQQAGSNIETTPGAPQTSSPVNTGDPALTSPRLGSAPSKP